MASLITISFFIREISIADRANPIVSENINFFISKYEDDFIDKLLGKALADAFRVGIAVGSPDAKWITLKNKLSDQTKLISPIANYVYYFIQDNATTTTAGTSETKAKNENSDPASVWDKQVKAWNDMVKLNCSIWEFVNSNSTDYPGLEQKGCNNIFEYINSFNL